MLVNWVTSNTALGWETEPVMMLLLLLVSTVCSGSKTLEGNKSKNGNPISRANVVF